MKGFIVEIPKEKAYLGRDKNVFVTQDRNLATPYGSINAAKVAVSHAKKARPDREFVITEIK